MTRHFYISPFVIALFLIAPWGGRAFAQESPSFYDYTRGGLSWHTIETAHFKVHYHENAAGEGSGRSARVVAQIAEQVYPPVTELYEYEPDAKVSIVLRDFEDYSNGAAYFFDNMIMLWSPALDSPLRGRHNWLRNVVTHEFTHIVQVQAAMKANRRLPFQYFQLLTYEEVRRPDVLYGYPDGIVTYPIPVLSNPAWLAEGTAQFQRSDLWYDTWDTHRDMLLRTRILEGRELSLADMGGFYSHNSLERETVYNQGFAFTQYLAAEFGEEALGRLSRSLGSWKVWNFSGGAKRALGVSGSALYDDWIKRLRTGYEESVRDIRAEEISGEIVQGDGFINLYPQYSPDGRRIAYLSNKGHDFGETALYVMEAEAGGEEVARLNNVGAFVPSYTCLFGHKVAPGIYGSFDWSPDGTRLSYARRKDTEDGSYFSDLYEYDLDSRTETRITRYERARSPRYSPGGDRLVFVSERDGTSNLYLMDTESDEVTAVTGFESGEQLSDPDWHPGGDGVFVTFSDGFSNGIYLVDISDGKLRSVIDSGADERNPFVDTGGESLYYASDATGIFNIYRISLHESSAPQQLTSVVGGAFMPSVGEDGSLVFARYEWDGYKIARLTEAESLDVPGSYDAPQILTKWEKRGSAQPVVDSHLTGYPKEEARPGGSVVPVPTVSAQTGVSSVPGAHDSLMTTEYRSDFTAFSFFPVLRLDQYVSRRRGRADVRLPDRTRGETLLRNTKVGFYVASREVLDGLAMLGGLLLGPASGESESFGDYFAPSSLLDLERDLFVEFDYRKGIFFRDKRWSPQLSLQLFNVRRNVDNGLAFEELACTACFPPDTTLADLSYNLWELDVAARSKISRSVLLEAGYRFSPYRVTTERFFSTEFQQTIPATSSRYYIGRAFRLKMYVEALRPHRHDDVIPEGLEAELSWEFEPGRLLDRFEVEDGILSPKYTSFRNHRLTADFKYGRRIPSWGEAPGGLSVRLRASTILGRPVDDFFDDYVGGLIGARGYPFYALGGNETLWLQMSYLVPIASRIHRQLWFVYADKLYARIFADAAYAWSGKFPGISDARRDVGAELRLGLGSFYLLPTAVFVSATYGIDEFEFDLDEQFVTPEGRSSIFYGRDLQWHFGVLFGFDL